MKHMYGLRAPLLSVKSETRYLQCKHLEQILASPEWWLNRSVLVADLMCRLKSVVGRNLKLRVICVAIIAATTAGDEN